MSLPKVNLKSVLGVLVLMTVAACASVPPGRLASDRMDYGQVMADSWKRQTLLNVVRLRYADAPMFLDVASVINSYSVGGKASAVATLPSATDPNVLSLLAEGTWTNTPTVTYQPLLGDRFTRSLLQPVPPSAVFQLLQSSWPADVVIPTVIRSINGLRNDSYGIGADPGFPELVEALSRIQRNGGLSIRVEARKEGAAVVIVLGRSDRDPKLLHDARRVRELLGLAAGIGEIEVAYGSVPRSDREIAMVTRSMMELMVELGFGVELPAAHVTDGRATPGLRQAGDAQSSALVRIRSGTATPADAYAAVLYKGHWYWIDETDIASKRVFTFLLILFSLAETGQGPSAPVVTVPSR